MLVVLAFFAGDKDQAIRLASWIRDLGGVKSHDCLLVVDSGTSEEGVFEPLQEAFKSVEVCKSLPIPPSDGKWGDGTTDASGPNEMFLTAVWTVDGKYKRPFLWMEADAVPLVPEWVDQIESEYILGGKPFMGQLVNIPPHEKHMSGIAVYPSDVYNHSLQMMQPGKMAWDYAGRQDTIERGKAHLTNLIHHVYRIDGEAPTFPTQESLSVINPEAVIFHRCKDETLIERLREGGYEPPKVESGFSIIVKGGDEPCTPQIREARQSISATANATPVGASNAVPTFKPEGAAMLADALRKIESLQGELRDIEEENSLLRAKLEKKLVNPLFAGMKPPKKQQMRKKRTISPENLAKLQAGRAKARLAKA